MIPAMVLSAAALLVGLFVQAFLMMRAGNRARRIEERRRAVIGVYLPVSAPRSSVRRLVQALGSSPVQDRLYRLAGMQPDRIEPYRARPWMVIPPAVCCGFIAHWLMRGVIGDYAWLVLPAVTLMIIRSAYRSEDQRRMAVVYRQFPDALAMIVRSVRVGIPVSEALWAVARDAEAPTSELFTRLADQVNIGTSLQTALNEMAERTHVPEYRFFAMAIGLQSQTGGGLTETLENLADAIRKRVGLKARGLALASEARTTAAVLALLPVLSCAALGVLDPAYLGPLFTTARGESLLGCTVLWLSIGLLAMRGMIKKSLA